MSGSAKTSKRAIAILDDWASLSLPIFRAVLGDELLDSVDLHVFNDTLPQYSHEDTTDEQRDELVRRLESFELICSMRERTQFPGELIRRLPSLRVLLVTGARVSSLDQRAAKECGITIATAHGEAVNSLSAPEAKGSGVHLTSEHNWALILALTKNVHSDSANLTTTNLWQTRYATRLEGRTLAVAGLGRLGIETAKLGTVFGMRVICWSENLTQEKADATAVEKAGLATTDPRTGKKTLEVVSKDQLFREADVLSVHYVLSDRSRGIVGRQDMDKMKPTSFLVNTSRGPVVDEDALYDVLSAGKIAGAALDVFDIEPLPTDSKWRTTKWGQEGRGQVILTPHMGYFEKDLMESWYIEQARNVQRCLKGEELSDRWT